MSKDDEGKKRGPKGPQSPRWGRPFQPDSGIDRLFVQLTKRGGLKEKACLKLIKDLGLSVPWTLRRLKMCWKNGWTWDFEFYKGRFRITNVQKDSELL